VNTLNKFEILGNWHDGFYWHLIASNARKLAWSGEKYQNKADCQNALNWIRLNAAAIPVFDQAA
jgi:uncharacterized protein YegP (UPF0339 family)